MITLGIDIGTTHTKVLALDTSTGRTLACTSAPTPIERSPDGEAHRPAAILGTVLELIAAAVSTLDDPGAVRALCVASVGEEVVLVSSDGTPVGDAIAWYDPRGLAEAKAFLSGPGRDLPLSRRWPPDPTFSLFKLLWIAEHAPDELGASATWTDLGDFVLHGLGAELVMDWSHAARAGAFDISARAWDEDTLALVGLDLAFPRLVPSGTVIGRLDHALADSLGLPRDLALVTGGHDHLCAAYGAGVRSTRVLFLSAGTSEAHLSLTAAPLESDGAHGIDQGCFVDDRTWYAHVNIHSGHFFQSWRRLLYAGVPEEEMYRELELADAGDITFDVGSDQRHGRLDGVPYDVERGALLRAVLEGLARRSADIVTRLEAATGDTYELVLVAGHPARVPLWRRLRQSTYGRPMAAVEEPEPTAYGAAVMAAAAMAPGISDQLVAARSAWD